MPKKPQSIYNMGMKINIKIVLVLAFLLAFPTLSSAQIYQGSGGDYSNTNSNYPSDSNVDRLAINCSADKTIAQLGMPVTWRASVLGGNGVYGYVWTGSDGLTGSQSFVTTAYVLPGIKNVAVTVYSNGQQLNALCTNSVTVSAVWYTPSAPKISKPVSQVKKVTSPADLKPQHLTPQNADTILQSIPWVLVAFLIFIVLILTIIYLIVNRKHIKH
jgi:hypothetical protein